MAEMLEYARRGSEDEQRRRPSLARLSLRLAIVVAVCQATVAGLYLLAYVGADHAAIEIVVIVVALSALTVWVIAVALTFAAWADHDGPRSFAATSMAVLAAEVAALIVAAKLGLP